jgi:hypothetical protein
MPKFLIEGSHRAGQGIFGASIGLRTGAIGPRFLGPTAVPGLGWATLRGWPAAGFIGALRG